MEGDSMMETILGLVSFLTNNLGQIAALIVALLVALVAVLHALIAIFALIPGAQPEKAMQAIVDVLQKAVDFVTKISRK
jgi:phage-related protein